MKYPIPEGRFKPTDKRTALDAYPSTAAHRRYDLVLDRIRDAFPDSDESNVSGNMVDATARGSLAVAYLSGGGSKGARRGAATAASGVAAGAATGADIGADVGTGAAAPSSIIARSAPTGTVAST